ncbi:DUF7882 family protein [Paramicrobacterium sp. CJ85]|uniref:DUF7882 family protein n=1 Tax=Paramicrobacterium sp. CJ85 TaxID=3445355 RepID=UPI003F5E240D
MWVSPTIPLQFRFSGSRPPTLNRVWLEVMADLSHTSRGLVLLTEAEAEAIRKNEQ